MSTISTKDVLDLITVKKIKKEYSNLNQVLDKAQQYIDKHGDVAVLPFPGGIMDKENIIFRRVTGKPLTKEQEGNLFEIKCTGDVRYCLHNYYSTDFVSIYRKILMHITNYDFESAEFNEKYGVLTIWWEFWTDKGTPLDKMNEKQVENMDLDKYLKLINESN